MVRLTIDQLDDRKWEASFAVVRAVNNLRKAIAAELTIGSPEVEQALKEYNVALKRFKRMQK